MNFESTQEPSENQTAPSAGIPSDDVVVEGEGDFAPNFIASGNKSSKRGVAVLGGLALAAAVVVWFMFFRSGPQSAQAGMAPSDGGSQIKQFLDSGNIN